MTPAALIGSFDGAGRPRCSNLSPDAWWRAASLFTEHAGRVRLRVLASECGVSHRTAWRMRERLRDTQQVIIERQRRNHAH